VIHEGPWDKGSQNKGSQVSGGLSQLSHYEEAPLWHRGPVFLKQKEGSMSNVPKGHVLY